MTKNRITESESSEHHEPKFRGTWTPAEVHHLLAEGEVTPTEFVLLTVIDSLVDSRGKGCWASNAYLAERLRKTPDHIKHLIGGLKAMGLLKQVGWKRIEGRDYRLLETAWSRVSRGAIKTHLDKRIGGDRSPPTGGIKTPQSLIPSELSKEERTSCRSAAPPDRSCDSSQSQEPTPKQSPSNDKAAPSGKKKEGTPQAAKPVPTGFLESLNGHAEDTDYQLAAQLADLLVGKKKALRHRIKLRSWAAAFRELLKEIPEDEIRDTMEQYVRLIDAPYMVQTFSAVTFCEKFRQVQSAIKRVQEAAKPKRPREPLNLLDPPPEYIDESEENYVPYDPEEDCIGEAD